MLALAVLALGACESLFVPIAWPQPGVDRAGQHPTAADADTWAAQRPPAGQDLSASSRAGVFRPPAGTRGSSAGPGLAAAIALAGAAATVAAFAVHRHTKVMRDYNEAPAPRRCVSFLPQHRMLSSDRCIYTSEKRLF